MTVTDAEVEAAAKAANAVRISYEDRLTSLPEGVWTAYDEKVARAALLAASQARALSSGEGWQTMEDFPADEQIVEVRRIGEPERWNAARYRRHHDATAEYMQWRRPQPPSKDNTNE